MNFSVINYPNFICFGNMHFCYCLLKFCKIVILIVYFSMSHITTVLFLFFNNTWKSINYEISNILFFKTPGKKVIFIHYQKYFVLLLCVQDNLNNIYKKLMVYYSNSNYLFRYCYKYKSKKFCLTSFFSINNMKLLKLL